MLFYMAEHRLVKHEKDWDESIHDHDQLPALPLYARAIIE